MSDTTPPAANDDPLVGTTIAGQFRIDKRLGAGGMGAVYLAEQAEMGRKVVVKVMHPELTVGSPGAVERFKREARAVAALNHPHIVQVYVFGQADDGRMYLAMEFIEGRDLAHELEAGPLDQARAIRILDQVASALTEAHTHGIVHRDLKPENIMLAQRHGNDDWVKVLDFGIAKVGAAEGSAALTQAGAIFGTPRYMAPEQIQGGTVDQRTDLYALGIILYELLTGRHPFRANSALDYLVKHVNEAVVSPTQANPNLALVPRLDAVLQRLLAKDPAARFQSAAELQRELRASLSEIGDPMSHTLSLSSAAVAAAVRASEYAPTVTAAPSASPVPAPKKNKKRALPWVVAGLVLVGGGVGAVVATSGGTTEGAGPVALAAPTPDKVEAVATTGAAEARRAASLREAFWAGEPTKGSAVVADAGEARGPEPDTSQAGAPDAAVAAGDVAVTPEAAVAVADTVVMAGSDAGVAAVADAGAATDEALHRALQDLEGLPVPEGTSVAATGPTFIELKVPARVEAVRAFYTQVLEGRVSATDEGFAVTDRRLAYTGLALSADGEETLVRAGRRPPVVARPKVEVEPKPPVPTPDPPPVTTPTPETTPGLIHGRRRPGRPIVGPTSPSEVTQPAPETTPGRRRPMRERLDTTPVQRMKR